MVAGIKKTKNIEEKNKINKHIYKRRHAEPVTMKVLAVTLSVTSAAFSRR